MKRKNNLPRVKVDVVVNIKKQVKARVKTMIHGGTCIVASEPLEKGKILTLEITYRDREIIKIKGKVMWSLKIGTRLYESGIDFFFIDMNRKEELVRFFN